MIYMQVELTDTFGGEANYSWVNRKTILVDENISDLKAVRLAKKAVGITGLKCKRENYGDEIRLDIVGANLVCFIIFNSEIG